MEGLSRFYWIVVWFLVGFGIPEWYGLRDSNDFQTLSATFRWLRDSLPWWAGATLSATVAAALLWLLTVHWIFSGVDRPGLDNAERFSIAAGVVLGVIGALISRRRKP